MIKLFGIFLIILSFIALGRKFAAMKRLRLDFLENMIACLSDFKAAIELFALPIPKAVEKSKIEKTAKEAFLKKCCNEEDERDFSLFIKGLKSETTDGQITNIKVYERKLKNEEERERERYKKEAKLIKGGFVLLGFLLVVMLL